MKYIKVKGKRDPISIAEWKDVEKIVAEVIKRNKAFLSELEDL